jgi:hypothetical protein
VYLTLPLGVLSVGSLDQNLGWGPVLVSLQVPQLTARDFLEECLALGSCLTLYVYLLQCLNSEQTVKNDMKMLLVVSGWLEQVYPRCVCPWLLPNPTCLTRASGRPRAQSPGAKSQTASRGSSVCLGRTQSLLS